ncbi:hypothetical protein [Nonlabens arenilitoris]|uniref:hypothetical protein n=1 Tax=Nonlabens arenilitoris TaxID=1217969 RepID=UPI0011B0E05D|nr:hypothetical protein [Nonlabens arenilitoris]
MKYFFIILTILGLLSLSSCEISDDGLKVSYSIVAVDSVQMPSTFDFGETYDIPVFYTKPSDCHVFDGFSVTADLNVRNISTVLAQLDSGNCATGNATIVEEQTLRFTAASNGSYVFRFFNGLGPNNEETYLEYTVFVLE